MIPPLTLLVAAATVGTLHMSAPDHWGTLIMLGRASGWGRSRLLGIGVVTAAGHVVLSVLLGFAIVGLGLLVSRQVSYYVTEGTGAVMVVGGLSYGVRELLSAREEDYEAEAERRLALSGASSRGRRFRYFAVLGAALSPDLSILPVFLLAVPLGWGIAVETAVVFGFASIAALSLFLLIGMVGLAKAFEKLPPRYNDALVGFVIAAVGTYVLVVG